VRSLGWAITLPEWEGCHLTTKAGPNAQALVGSIEDAALLTEEQISNLRILGGDALIRSIETSKLLSPLTWLEYFGLTPKGRSAKLSLVRDKEAKTRIVAILDYWTQSGLKPLHDAEMRFLRGLKPDMTFNQGGFRSTLTGPGPFHSLDLTAATDRFPVEIQEAVLGTLLGREDVAAAWRQLICDRDYTISWGNRRDTVRYACGQPMGAYSSWSTFSICHHVVVRAAAVRAGLSPTFAAYALLGDDIVIANNAVALEYRTIMDQLGVALSVAKTHVSQDTYEFAKRWIHRGTEVTGAPLGSLFEAMSLVRGKRLEDLGKDFLPTQAIKHVSFYGVVAWFREIEERWTPRSSVLGSRGLFAALFHVLGRGSLGERLAHKAWKLYLLPSREDRRQRRRVKLVYLAELVAPGMLGCFEHRAPYIVWALWTEGKTKVLEAAIKNQLSKLIDFQKESGKLARLVPEGLDAQSILPSLAPLAVLRRNIAELQLEWDKARAARGGADAPQSFDLDVRLFLDPFAVLSTRRSKTVAATTATIVNHIGAIATGLQKIRLAALGPKSEKSVYGLIQTARLLPTRGDRPKRTSRKGGPRKTMAP